MSGTDDGEVSPIERGDRTDTKSLSKGNYGRIDGPERKVVIPGYELRYPDPESTIRAIGGPPGE